MKHTNKSFSRFLPIAIGIVLIVALGTFWLWNNSKDTTNTAAGDNLNTLNLDPPTEEEKKAGDEQKQQIVDEEEHPAEQTNVANLVIADAGQYGDTVEVRAFVSNRIDTNGTCTVTLTSGEYSVTRSKSSTADASTTQCGTIDIPRSEFPVAGKWNVKITYTADDASGQATSSITLR